MDISGCSCCTELLHVKESIEIKQLNQIHALSHGALPDKIYLS